MRINEKILKFFEEKGVSKQEIADSYGGSIQNTWNILNRESGKVPLDFLIWLIKDYPEVNLNLLLSPDENVIAVSEPKTVYEKKPATKAEILLEVEKVLDKYL